MGFIGHGGNLTKRLWWLLVGDDLTADSVDTREVLRFTLAAFECAVNICSRSIELATDTIEDVFAEFGSVGACWVTSFQAEDLSTHEVVPFNSLDVVAIRAGQGITEEKATERVTTLISTMGVEFSSRIVGLDVNQFLFDVSNDYT
jgi:hypothetical protein